MKLMKHLVATMSATRTISYLVTFVFAALLTACGGGGGNPGSSSGSSVKTPLFTTAPASLSLMSGASSPAYTISGGVGPYTASPDSPSLITVSLSGSVFTISTTAGKSGNASVTIADSAGTKITMAVTVPSPETLFSTAPATLQILSGTTNFYSIYGGTAPYVANGNGPIARVVLSGANLAITGLVPGHQTVAVSDAKGAVFTIDVTVNQGMYTDAPANITVASGTGNNYTIFGGVPFSAASPYRINNSNPAVASASLAGTTLTISAISSGSTSLVISDSVGATLLITVTVPVPGAILSTAPSSLSLATGTSGTYSISGGVAPYTVASSNPSMVSATVNGSILTIGAVADTVGGAANVIVSDSKGTPPLTMVVTTAPVQFFTTAPSQLAISAGTSKVFAVFGGSLPYSVVNTHPAVVSGVITNSTLTITGSIAGSGTVIVSDAKGVSISIAVVVNAPGPLFLSAPSSVFIARNTANTYDIIGGIPPYLVATSNVSVIQGAIINANQVRVLAVGPGSATFVVTDSAGTQVSVDVLTENVVTPVSPIAFFVAAPSSINMGVSPLPVNYQIGGGTQPYYASSSDIRVATVSASSNSLAITGVAPGTATIVISDALGASKTIAVTVGNGGTTPVPLYVTAPTPLKMGAGSPAAIYAVSGGTMPYTAASSDTRVATVSVTSAGVLAINALAVGNATLKIADAIGAFYMISVVVDSTTTGPSAVASIDILASSNSLSSAPGSSISFIVTVKDAVNAALPNQMVGFSASSGTLAGTNPTPTTNAAGTISAVTLSPGADASNRNIVVTAIAGAISKTITIPVVGTTITVSGPGAALVGSAAQNFTIKAVDSGGKPIVGATLTFASALGNGVSPSTVTTDSSGAATVAFTAAVVGTDTLTASGLGASGTASVIVSNVDFGFIAPTAGALLPVSSANLVTVRYRVAGVGVAGQTVTFGSTRGTLSATTAITTAPNGDATVSVSSPTAGPVTVSAQLGTARSSLTAAFVATVPNNLVLQANPAAVLPNTSGSTTNQSALTAIVRDAAGNPVQGVVVNFAAVTDGSNGSIAPGSATTDANGLATAQFIPGPLSTAANGVQIKATVQANPSITSTAVLTVNGSALFISIARSGTLTAFDSTTYQKDFSVYVTDATGAPSGNRAVSLSVDPFWYFKGNLTWDTTNTVWKFATGSPTGCANEDELFPANPAKYQNGILDSGEDINGNGKLEPGIPAVITSTVTTDALGFASFTLRFGKNYAWWVSTKITAKSLVGGTESQQVQSYDLEMTSTDKASTSDPANVVSPFGKANVCTDPN